MSNEGFFIVFEGGEGAGKSTLTEAIGKRLENSGRSFVVIREPGGTPVAETLREILKTPLTPWGEALAFLTARADLIEKVIRPALKRGDVVLCDRFSPSTFAYQGYGRNLDLKLLKKIDSVIREDLEPNLIIFCDVPVSDGLARKAGENDPIVTGSEKEEFHRRVYSGYQDLMSNSSEKKWRRIDATKPPIEVAEEVWSIVEPMLRL
ncbi:MAG: dTMP kinase [Tepidiformaceae bacterium]